MGGVVRDLAAPRRPYLRLASQAVLSGSTTSKVSKHGVGESDDVAFRRAAFYEEDPVCRGRGHREVVCVGI